MSMRQSELLLNRVRSAIQKRGWNTAALAEAMGEDRKRIRNVLGGKEPLTVDDFGRMVEVLQITAEEMAMTMADAQKLEEPEPPRAAGGGLAVAETSDGDDDEWRIDPEGPQAEQIFRMGFGLGIDMLFVCETQKLTGSGIPSAVLARFPDKMPIKLDAAFHRHNRPRFLAEGVELRLSFDQVYTCMFPWSALVQVTLFPEAPEEEEAPPAPPTGGRPTLTLVKR